jgi:predicted  nucleic acid-binding Zn-ribbon protein
MVAFLAIKRQTGMAQLETAQQRLAEALQRLEAALARRMVQPSSAAATDYELALAAMTAERNDLARDVSILRSECDRLSAALSEIQRDHRSLRDVTSHVAQRIDGSIAEIDRLLEG